MSPSPKTERNQRGLLSTELAVLMPIMLMLAVLAVYVVQVERHSSRAQQAADAAARAASLTRNFDDARVAAQSAADAVCNGTAIILDDFSYTPPDLSSFTPGRVGVRLTCTEPFRGFTAIGGDGLRTESGVAVSAIEYWRSSP